MFTLHLLIVLHHLCASLPLKIPLKGTKGVSSASGRVCSPGVIIGGVAFVFCLAVGLVVLSLRVKHRRQLARMNAAGERRLSRYPGGHLSITDEDVAQIPGTGAAMRESLCHRYTRASAYAPMASRETIEKQSGKKMILSMPKSEVDDIQNKAVVNKPASLSGSPVRGWPLPRRLTRANRPPAIDLRLPLPSPVTNAMEHPEASTVKPKSAEMPKLTPRDEYSKARSPQPSYHSPNILGASPQEPLSPSPILRPKPLFHEKQRSVSYGMISEINRQKRSGSAQVDHESHKLYTNSSRLALPRSISLTSQEPGTIPITPIPPLPAEALAIRRQRSRKASSSNQSPVAATSKHNFDGPSKTDVSPIAAMAQTTAKSPKNSESQVKKDQSVVDRRVLRPPVSPTVARTGTMKAPLGSRKSFQASIQDSITRSNSSGLSESLLNHGWSRSGSNVSMMKEVSHARSKPPASGNNGAHISIFDFGLPLRSDIDVGALSQLDSGDSQAKRRSTSILQIVLGNEQSPTVGSRDEKPISIATDVPIRWSTDHLTGGTNDHKKTPDGMTKARHRSKRSSIKQQSTPMSKSQRTSKNVQKSQLPGVTPQYQPQSLRRPRIDPPAFRPPSKLTFDPQLTQRSHSKPPPPCTPSSPDSYLNNTLARLTGHDDSDSSANSPPSTPTRKPSQKRQPSGTHPNRQRAVFDGPSKTAQWPLAGQQSVLSLGLRTANDESLEKANNIFRHDAQLNLTTGMTNRPVHHTVNDNSVAPSSRPPSLLYRFPSPPSPPFRNANGSGASILDVPNILHSYSQPSVRKPGPEIPVSPSQSVLHSKTATNLGDLTREDHKNDDAISNNQSSHLRQSVLALRRMNSEISEPSKAGREHRRYLSLGQKEEAIFEDETGSNVGSGSVKRMDSTSTVITVLDAPTSLSLSSKRKEEGEEKENDKGRRAVVRGPRAMPGWLDESMMSSSSSYARNMVGAEQTSRNWFEGEEFSKLF